MRCGRSRRMRTTNVVRELSTHQAAMPPRVVVATQACHADLAEDACTARTPPWPLARRLPHEHFPMLNLSSPCAICAATTGDAPHSLSITCSTNTPGSIAPLTVDPLGEARPIRFKHRGDMSDNYRTSTNLA